MESNATQEKSSFVSHFKSLAVPMSTQPQRAFFMAQLMLRALALLLSVAAIITMLTNGQNLTIMGIVIEARYNYSSAFRFIVGADAIVCVCSALSMFLVFILSRPKSDPSNYYFLFLHDLVVALLIMAGCAAATAIGVVGRDGQVQSGWPAICNRVEEFCHKSTVSIAMSYLAFLCYLSLTVMAVNKLKKKNAQEASQGGA
ncbi:hypothetical protein NMG60_11026766 [Bertholletia excelsa]